MPFRWPLKVVKATFVMLFTDFETILGKLGGRLHLQRRIPALSQKNTLKNLAGVPMVTEHRLQMRVGKGREGRCLLGRLDAHYGAGLFLPCTTHATLETGLGYSDLGEYSLGPTFGAFFTIGNA